MSGKQNYPGLYNSRMLAVLITSLSSGIPLLLTSSTLQAWYSQSNVNLMTIGLLSFIGMPYLLKVLWAPLMDRFVPFAIGRRKSWIVCSQAAVIATLLIMSVLDPGSSPNALAGVALALAFFSASQDIVIDAYRTDISMVHERGLAGSLLAIGYRLAMLLSGALALILAAKFSWHRTYQIMAIIMLLLLIYSLFIPGSSDDDLRPTTIKSAILDPMSDFLKKDKVMMVVLFIILYKFSDALALSLNTTFLLRGVGFDLATVGVVSKGVGLLAVILGSLAGGLLYPKLGLYRSLMIFGVLQITSNLLFVWLAIVGHSIPVLTVSIFGEYFCGGIATTAFVALLMSLCSRRYSATQYALLSAVASIGRVFCGPLAAVLVADYGWIDFYIATFILGIPSLLVLFWLGRCAGGKLFAEVASRALP